MRYFRTSGLSMLEALRPLSASLDACWWYLGGHGFQMTRDFVERLHSRHCSEQELHEYWMQLLGEYVFHDTPVGRVGKPGFFTQLADSVDFQWACHFAIEGDEMPLPSLRVVAEKDSCWFGPVAGLPPDVVLVARDIDAAYQEYGVRDKWMFETALGHLRRTGHPADEVTEWPNKEV
jgi:hypothetical protein